MFPQKSEEEKNINLVYLYVITLIPSSVVIVYANVIVSTRQCFVLVSTKKKCREKMKIN